MYVCMLVRKRTSCYECMRTQKKSPQFPYNTLGIYLDSFAPRKKHCTKVCLFSLFFVTLVSLRCIALHPTNLVAAPTRYIIMSQSVAVSLRENRPQNND